MGIVKMREKGPFSVLLAFWLFLGSCSPEPIDFAHRRAVAQNRSAVEANLAFPGIEEAKRILAAG